MTKRRSRVRDNSEAVAELRTAIDFNRSLAGLAKDTGERAGGIGLLHPLFGAHPQAISRQTCPQGAIPWA